MFQNRFTVERSESNHTLAAFLKARLQLSWSKARAMIHARRVRVNGAIVPDDTLRLRAGAVVELVVEVSRPPAPKREPRPKPPNQPPREASYDGPLPGVVYLDDSILVVEKPAGLTTMRHAEEAAEFGPRGKHYLPKTLQDLLPGILSVAPGTIRAVHRIDRDTTGLVVFARNSAAEKNLDEQFRKHTIQREYLALVRGRAEGGRVESYFIPDRGDGRRGSNRDEQIGQKAVTFLEVLERFAKFSFVRCRLDTGRTHQVRIHLGERGNPLCGERVYDRPVHGAPIPDESGAGRPMLHATVLGLRHPETGEPLRWESPLPEDMRKLLEEWRANPAGPENA